MEKLLNKKGWTGAELGKLSIANFMLNYKKNLENNTPSEDLLISESEFKKMLSTIKDPLEQKTYNGYVDIYDWLIRNLQASIAQEQQAQLQHNALLNAVSNALFAEDMYIYISQLPAIMTQKQYDDSFKEWAKENFKTRVNILELIFFALDYYSVLFINDPSANNILKPLKKELDKKPVKNKHILDRYNKITDNGYYTLEDGTRSDKLSREAWHELLGYDGLNEDETERRGKELAHIMFYKGVTRPEAEEILEEQDIKTGKRKKCTWHYYDNAPEDLTKWEILISDELREYFIDAKTGGYTPEQAKIFAKEFPEATKAILEDMAKNYPDFEYFKNLPPEKWTDKEYSTTWETLYNLDFYNFKEMHASDINVFDGQHRAVANGIAILKPSRFSIGIGKETGYFFPPDIRNTLSGNSLEKFFPESENYAQNIDFIEDLRETFISSLYYIKAYNVCLDLISSMYDIEEILILKSHAEAIEEKAKALNDLICFLYEKIACARYEDDELKKKKLDVLKNILYPINLAETIVPKKRIAQTKEAIKDFKAFTDNRLNPSNLLCFYDPEAIREALENGEGV